MTPRFLQYRRAIDPGPAMDRSSVGTLPDLAVKRILVPLDFSESSRAALSHALKLALYFKAEVLLLHIFEPVPPGLRILESAFVEPSFRDQAARELNAWRDRVPAEVAHQALFRQAKSVYREILKTAAEFDVELIVLGRHGRKGVGRLLMGSTAEQVIRHANCAVLVSAPQ